MRRKLILTGTAIGLLFHGAIHAQQSEASFPSKAIRLVVPFPPGGSVDPTARLLASKLGPRIGQSVVVDNQAGGNGVIGMQAVARAAPDGYTLLLGTPTGMVTGPLLSKDLPYNVATDFAPVTQIISNPFILVVPASLPVKSVKDLIDYANRNPGKLNYGSPGQGSPGQIAIELLKGATNIDMTYIPYKGSGPAQIDMLAGRLHLYASSIIGVSENVKAGKLYPIAVTSARRANAMKDVPTVAESGVPGYEFDTWYGIFAPARTPTATIGKLNSEIAGALNDPEVVKIMTNEGSDVRTSTPAALGALVKTQTQRIGQIIQKIGLTTQ